MSQGDHVGCWNTNYRITLRISTAATRAINAAMITILLGTLYSANPSIILSALPENISLYFPTKYEILSSNMYHSQVQKKWETYFWITLRTTFLVTENRGVPKKLFGVQNHCKYQHLQKVSKIKLGAQKCWKFPTKVTKYFGNFQAKLLKNLKMCNSDLE